MRSHKKSKQKHREKKKYKKRHRSSSSSSSSSSNSSSSASSDEWVEEEPKKESNDEDCNKKSSKNHSEQREEWMSEPVEFSGYSRDQLKKKKEPKDDEKKFMIDRLGQTDRELNPYWKDGGSGLPQECKDLSVPRTAIGDHGVEWLRKALQRAKEQAAEEGRRLEDVVAERWESLEKLESMIKEAESRTQEKVNHHSENKKYCDYKDKSGSHFKYNNRGGKDSYGQSYSSVSRKHEFLSDRDLHRKHFMKPSEDESVDIVSDYKKEKSDKSYDKESYRKSFSSFSRKNEPTRDRDLHRKHFMKPSDDESGDIVSHYKKSQNDRNKYSSTSSGKGWRKNPPHSETIVRDNTKSDVSEETATNNSDESTSKSIESYNTACVSSQPVFLSADERNELAAKLIKAEIMGNTDLVKKLKSRLEEARTVAAEAQQTVVLTHTDSKGFTQPLSLPSKPEYGRNKKAKIQTHEGGQRIRYFADDDNYSLQEMFEKEKRSTVDDHNEEYARVASQNVGRNADDEFDAIGTVIRAKSAVKDAEREHHRAITQNRRSIEAVENCQWCLDGKRLLKHCVITVGSKVFLYILPHESLAEEHCLLIPRQHVSCSTLLDEDVWEELQVFRKALVQMFLANDMDVVFFEYAMNLSRSPHMVWQCVPLPKSAGEFAPMYFKKAILECETEWASNKKLVDLAGKNVRRVIPRGLPYFTVDFGLQSGFAHVIEEEKYFPKYFAEEIIGGLMDVDYSKWRKPKKLKFEEQSDKILKFSKLWQPFNCIKKDSRTCNK